jgi:hypothetical protein
MGFGKIESCSIEGLVLSAVRPRYLLSSPDFGASGTVITVLVPLSWLLSDFDCVLVKIEFLSGSLS